MEQRYSVSVLIKKLALIFHQFNPLLVYFFGSAYREKMGPLSDIDLAVLWPREVNVPMIESLNLQNEIQQLLQDKRFEVGCLNGQNLSFCHNVISTGTLIYGKKEDQVAYETDILSRYLDFSYFAEEYNRSFDQRTMRGSNG